MRVNDERPARGGLIRKSVEVDELLGGSGRQGGSTSANCSDVAHVALMGEGTGSVPIKERMPLIGHWLRPPRPFGSFLY